jgi:type IV pilus assembly protein PilO
MAMDFDELKRLSPKIKALIVCLVYILLGYFYFMFFFQDALTMKMALDTKLAGLTQEIAEKEKTVAQIDRYIREVNLLREAFKTALLKLPNEREIAGLLASVVLAGQEAGVNFLLFEPKPPVIKPPETKPGTPAPPKPADAKTPPKPAVPEKFYDEIPVKVQLNGSFFSTVSFFEKVAQLSRIVNVEEIDMGEGQDVKGRGWTIKTSCIVKTYMFVDKIVDKK